MSNEDVPEVVQDRLSEDGVTDVSDEYSDAIEMFVEMAENRSLPVPMRHVLAYTIESRPGTVLFLFVIDNTSDATYAFETAMEADVAEHLPADDVEERHSDHVDLAIQQFNAQIRTAKEELWKTVVNDPFER